MIMVASLSRLKRVTPPGQRNRGDLMAVVKLMLPGVLGQVTSRPSSGDLRFLQGFGVVPTTAILLAGVKRMLLSM
ncbi:hypothetical protein VC81_04190 [Levilactobacillus spicheri]|uniref:Uncharacterized protein n=1 Tax=Levilactobacillus spicheri TaxID=216463 RepID=A0A0F3RTH7_9LACO|nr:hypothetical protein VC81_04190 [Levilactobacillus spicheri]